MNNSKKNCQFWQMKLHLHYMISLLLQSPKVLGQKKEHLHYGIRAKTWRYEKRQILHMHEHEFFKRSVCWHLQQNVDWLIFWGRNSTNFVCLFYEIADFFNFFIVKLLNIYNVFKNIVNKYNWVVAK